MKYEDAMLAVARGSKVIMPLELHDGDIIVLKLSEHNEVDFDFDEHGNLNTIQSKRRLVIDNEFGATAFINEEDMHSDGWQIVTGTVTANVRPPEPQISAKKSSNSTYYNSSGNAVRLPTWIECNEIAEDGQQLTALQKFILIHEPQYDDEDFRQQLIDVLLEATRVVS